MAAAPRTPLAAASLSDAPWQDRSVDTLVRIVTRRGAAAWKQDPTPLVAASLSDAPWQTGAWTLLSAS